MALPVREWTDDSNAMDAAQETLAPMVGGDDAYLHALAAATPDDVRAAVRAAAKALPA